MKEELLQEVLGEVVGFPGKLFQERNSVAFESKVLIVNFSMSPKSSFWFNLTVQLVFSEYYSHCQVLSLRSLRLRRVRWYRPRLFELSFRQDEINFCILMQRGSSVSVWNVPDFRKRTFSKLTLTV